MSSSTRSIIDHQYSLFEDKSCNKWEDYTDFLFSLDTDRKLIYLLKCLVDNFFNVDDAPKREPMDLIAFRSVCQMILRDMQKIYKSRSFKYARLTILNYLCEKEETFLRNHHDTDFYSYCLFQRVKTQLYSFLSDVAEDPTFYFPP